MQAARLIEDRIASGDYQPGQRLNLALIADEMGVERDTVSRGVRVLADRGLLTFWRGLGWYVGSAGPGNATPQ